MRVGLFIPCYVDQLYPQVAIATLNLLEKYGCEVVYPADQTCCGQPGWNSGDRESARELALKLIAEFEAFAARIEIVQAVNPPDLGGTGSDRTPPLTLRLRPPDIPRSIGA